MRNVSIAETDKTVWEDYVSGNELFDKNVFAESEEKEIMISVIMNLHQLKSC